MAQAQPIPYFDTTYDDEEYDEEIEEKRREKKIFCSLVIAFILPVIVMFASKVYVRKLSSLKNLMFELDLFSISYYTNTTTSKPSYLLNSSFIVTNTNKGYTVTISDVSIQVTRSMTRVLGTTSNLKKTFGENATVNIEKERGDFMKLFDATPGYDGTEMMQKYDINIAFRYIAKIGFFWTKVDSCLNSNCTDVVFHHAMTDVDGIGLHPMFRSTPGRVQCNTEKLEKVVNCNNFEIYDGI